MSNEARSRIEVPYPFVRTTYEEMDENGISTVKAWKPGTEHRFDRHVGKVWEADRMGHQILIEVSSHSPGKGFAERIFYQRRWRDPDGTEFGKKLLRVTTRAMFTRMKGGYRHHFRLCGEFGANGR